MPAWVRARFPEPVRDDPALCPPEVPGQLGLFPTPRRLFTITDGARIHGRSLPDLELVCAELGRMASERGVGPSWVIPLSTWHSTGISTPRQVTAEHIEAALESLAGHHARSVHGALRSLFRALRRERLIFRDPARTVSLTSARPLPTTLPSDRLTGILDQLPDSRSRLIVALVAVHALAPQQVASLRLADLDRSKARQRVRRPQRLDHVFYLDGFLMNLVYAWIRDRHQRWPDSTNPYLIVSRQTAIDSTGPAVCAGVIKKPFRHSGFTAQALRTDRILDEARDSADPVRLMRQFGIANVTAVKYVFTAHPDKRPHPIGP
ncbi:hypothetical protein [Kitasatospora sp. GP82]|uniref:hypothetical protein n=1 Tax=Kitasatospora sp. GP82 TaxID=3035089 RepID=UPI0024752531|nr:hypothetical protein [Kitasatospora sp. GP82]